MNSVILKTAAVICMVLTVITGLTVFPAEGEAEETVVLKQGSTGSQVKTMQTKLKNWGYYNGNIDGIFGSQTTAAVKYFQRVNGLAVDGIVGAKTAAALGMTLSSGSSSNSGYSSSDLYLLANAYTPKREANPTSGRWP